MEEKNSVLEDADYDGEDFVATSNSETGFNCVYYLKEAEKLGETTRIEFPSWANVTAFPRRDQHYIQFTKCIIGIENLERTIFAGSTLRYYDTQYRNVISAWPRFLEGWLLPAIFGALGAVIYHLRVCINPLRPDPSLGQAVMRIFLAAVAGISFGWFFSPATSEILGQGLPLGTYAIAFLIGYSIDVFYALLDKAVVAVLGWVEGLDASKAAKG